MLLIALAVAAATGVEAQPADPAANSQIVVTASLVPVSAALSGTALTVIDAQTIQSLNLPLVADYLRLVPSVSVATTGPLGSQTQVRIRGAEGNHTLTQVDGIEVNDPASSGEFRFETLLADGIERIEVLRGPQSALWGSEAIGGVVNVLTRVPGSGNMVFGEAEGGSFGTYRVGAGGAAGSDKGGITAQATYLDARGIDTSDSGGDKDGYENLTLTGKGVLRPRDNLELGVVGRFSNSNSKFDDFDYVAGTALDAPLSTRTRQLAVRGYASLGLLEDRLTQTVDVQATGSANINRNDGDFQNRSDGRRLKVGYRASGTATGGDFDHRLTFAAEYERQRFTSKDADPTAQSNQRRTRHQTSFIGEYRVEHKGSSAFGISVRHDDSDRYANSTTVRATGAVALPAGFRAHASYGQGVADPTFFDLYGFFPGFFVGNPNLKPEKSRGGDAGLGWSNGTFTADLTAYTANLQNEIVSTFDNKTFLSGVANATGRSHRRGIEASADVRATDWLKLGATYAYLKASQQTVASGLRLRELRRPRDSGSFYASATRGPATMTAGIAYVGSRHDTNFASFRDEKLHDYALITLSGSYEIRPGISLTGRIENAGDADYQDVVGYRTQGIGVHGGIRVRL